jgi:ketosteroid isomerase-like protein
VTQWLRHHSNTRARHRASDVRWAVLVILTAAAGLSPSLLAQEPAGRAALRRELEAEARKLERAFERGDMVAVARAYADNAQMIPPGGHPPVAGRSQIDRYWGHIRDPRSWQLETLDFGGNADEAWHLVRSTMVAGAERTSPPHVVRCLFIWRRQADGTRRIHLDIWTERIKS